MPRYGELIDLVDCQPADLTWVAGWYDAAHTKPTGWHLYQFGLGPSYTWQDTFPAVMPVCRALSFKRANHGRWATVEKYTANSYWCHKCIVEIVMKFPHIFTGEPR